MDGRIAAQRERAFLKENRFLSLPGASIVVPFRYSSTCLAFSKTFPPFITFPFVNCSLKKLASIFFCLIESLKNNTQKTGIKFSYPHFSSVGHWAPLLKGQSPKNENQRHKPGGWTITCGYCLLSINFQMNQINELRKIVLYVVNEWRGFKDRHKAQFLHFLIGAKCFWQRWVCENGNHPYLMFASWL